jgi:hypothetical protein
MEIKLSDMEIESLEWFQSAYVGHFAVDSYTAE